MIEAFDPHPPLRGTLSQRERGNDLKIIPLPLGERGPKGRVRVERVTSIEDNRLVSVEENAVCQVPPHSARQNDALEIAAFLDQVLQLIAVGYPNDILLDDRPLIQIIRDVMTRRSDKFYTVFERGMVWPGSCESR